jgi:hypothetical protein
MPFLAALAFWHFPQWRMFYPVLTAQLSGQRRIRAPQTFFIRSPRQDGREAWAAVAINYDGNPDQDGRPAGPVLQVLRVQSW